MLMLTTPRIKDMAEEQAGRVEEPEDELWSLHIEAPESQHGEGTDYLKVLLPYTEELWKWVVAGEGESLFTEDMVHGGFPFSSG